MDCSRREFIKLGVGAAVSAGLAMSLPRRADAEAVTIGGAAAAGMALVGLGLAFGAAFRGNADRAVLGQSWFDRTAEYADQIADSAAAAAAAAHQTIDRSVVRDYALNGQLVQGIADLAADAYANQGRMGLAVYDGLNELGFGMRAAFANMMDGLLAAPAAVAAGAAVPFAVEAVSDLSKLNVVLNQLDFLSADAIATASNLPTAATFAWVIHYPFSATGHIVLVIAGQDLAQFSVTNSNNNNKQIIFQSSSTVERGAGIYYWHSSTGGVGHWSIGNGFLSNPYTLYVATNLLAVVASTVCGIAGSIDLPWGAERKPDAVLDPPMPWDLPLLGVDWKDVLGVVDDVGSIALPDVIGAGLDIAFPGIDAIDWPWEKALWGEQVGIIEGIDAIDWPWEITDVQTRVGTIEGTQVMPLERTLDIPTSITKAVPEPLFPPFNPPKIDAPWEPAAKLPLPTVFPFNMTYSFLEWLGGLFS